MQACRDDPCFSLRAQNALLPAGLRQRDQTQKPPTGPFKREELMAHLEKQAKDVKDREDLVPFTGEKRGTVIPHTPARAPGHVNTARPPAQPSSKLPAPS